MTASDNPAQAVIGAVIVGAAVMTARSRRRIHAVLLVGVTGYGTTLLFVLQGAPDLALTQALVETLTVVVYVLALRRSRVLHRPPLTASATSGSPWAWPWRS